MAITQNQLVIGALKKALTQIEGLQVLSERLFAEELPMDYLEEMNFRVSQLLQLALDEEQL